MADAVVVSCPECSTKIKVREELQGKKVRCKGCGHTFVAPVGPPRKTSPGPTAIKTKAPPRPARDAEDEDAANPYGVTQLDLSPRCPHCAKEMESADAIVCLNCGYNTQTREHIRTKKTIQQTGQDKFMWLLPGLLCILLIFFCLGFDVFFVVGLLDWWKAIAYDWELPSLAWGINVWVGIISLFIIFYAARFAVRRLILNPSPPEVEKR
jgi:predicted Zn finger-like uncharacterized protein